MGDWKEHLKVHLKDWKEFQHFDSNDVPLVECIVQAILDGQEIDGGYDSEDIEDLKRLLELCEATDEEREGRQFAGNAFSKDNVIHVPLSRADISLIHRAVDDAIETKVTDIARRQIQLRERASKK